MLREKSAGDILETSIWSKKIIKEMSRVKCNSVKDWKIRHKQALNHITFST